MIKSFSDKETKKIFNRQFSRHNYMSKKFIPPIHPGEILNEEFLKPIKITQYRLAKDIGVPPRRINEIVKGIRAISVDTALRLGRYFGTAPQFWLHLQNHYDLETESSKIRKRLEKEVKILQRV